MKCIMTTALGCLLVALTTTGTAAPKKPAAPTLTPHGAELRAKYDAQLISLKAEITRAVPAAPDQLKATLKTARDAAKKAQADADAARKPVDAIKSGQGLVDHAKKKWIAGADKGIKETEAALKKAPTDAERAELSKKLAHWQANKADGEKALAERQAALDSARANEARNKAAYEAAKAALATARAAEQAAEQALLGVVTPVISTDALDAKLVPAAVLAQATPAGLAAFAEQSPENEGLVETLLNDTDLMKEMLAADGAADGNYGQAMKIFTAIRKASSRSESGVLRRLAMGTALEHATPIEQVNAKAEPDAPKFVDPVNRYLHYEKAFLAGELDPAFEGMSTWECRMIVDCNSPDDILAWGREMLRNYRPDHITNSDYGWRYSGAVRTDVAYRHSDKLNDTDTLGFYQNICKEGGICGRRAFFGRYIIKAFGLPAVARPQPRHAALGRWTPNGWVINLGAGWGAGKGVNGRTDLDFVMETKVREFPTEHIKARRADWIADVLGEAKYNGYKPEAAGFWRTVAHTEAERIAAAAKSGQLEALGANLGEANESDADRAQAVTKVTLTDADKKVNVGANGVITVPAGACSGSVSFVKSFSGGVQMVCGGGAFTCTVDAPKAGTYQLTHKVVTVHENLNSQLSVNKAGTPVKVDFPYTCGMWDTTPAVEVTLAQGKNVLTFAKPTGNLTIKEFTLTPVK